MERTWKHPRQIKPLRPNIVRKKEIFTYLPLLFRSVKPNYGCKWRYKHSIALSPMVSYNWVKGFTNYPNFKTHW